MAAVEIDDLAEERDFFHPLRDERPDLGHDLRDGARTFRTARARHDAESAVHVAALHDRDEGGNLFRREQMIPDRVLRTGLLRDIDNPARRLLPVQPLLEKRVDMPAHLVEFLRADDQIDVGQLVEDRGAPALRHAAEKTDHLMLAMLLAPAEGPHLADRLLLGHVADGAGVEQHHIGVLLPLDQLVAAAGQIARHLLGIADIHLAAVGFDEDGRHGRRAAYPARSGNSSFP